MRLRFRRWLGQSLLCIWRTGLRLDVERLAVLADELRADLGEAIQRQAVELLLLAADGDGNGALLNLLIADDDDEGILHGLVVFDLLVHVLVGVVRLAADAEVFELFDDFLRVVVVRGADRHDGDLIGREPEGERTLEVLDDDADEALEGAVDGAVDDDGHLDAALLGLIGQAEIVGQLEVQLDGAALPFAAQRVLDLEVDLRAIEGAVALVDLILIILLLF